MFKKKKKRKEIDEQCDGRNEEEGEQRCPPDAPEETLI